MESFFIKNKKYFVFVLAAAVVFNFMFLPIAAWAQDITGDSAATPPGQTTAAKDDSNAGGVVGWLAGKAVLFTSSVISTVLGAILGVILFIEAQIIDYMLSPNNFSFTGSPVVTLGWGITRDLSNMFLILILLVIAFATVLKIQSYAIKQLWWKVVAVALLINFSLVFAGVIIDFAQVMTNFFLKQALGGDTSMGAAGTITTRLASSMQILNFYNPAKPDGALAGIGQFGASAIAAVIGIILTLVGLVITVFVFGATAVFLVVRIIYIWFLLIVIPIVCIFWILPATSGYFSKWWSTFFNWTFFAPAYMFMIYLSLSLFDTQGKLNPKAFWAFSGPGWDIAPPGLSQVGMPSAIFQWILVIAMMFGSLIVAKSFGVMFAGASEKMLTGWGDSAKNWTGRQLRRGYVKGTKPETPTPPPAGAGLRQRMGYRFRQAGAAIGKGALAIPGLREKQLRYMTQENAAYKATYDKYKGLSPALLEQVESGILDPRARLAIQQLQMEKDVLKPGAAGALNLLDKAHGYGQEAEFLKIITEKLGKNGWKSKPDEGGFDAGVIAQLLDRAERYAPALEQNLLKQMAEEMKKDFTGANGYDDNARKNLIRRSQKFGKEQDFLKFFPNLAPAIGKKVNETVAKIENAADIYEDQLVADVVKELSPDQLKSIARKGGDDKVRKVRDVIEEEYKNIHPTIKNKIQNEILNKNMEVTETDAMGKRITKQVTITKEMRNHALGELAPDLQKIARAKHTMKLPIWDIS
ncbi:MAG: hypothetical protein UV53_C0011G0010 [Candidatus Azambacteria bacterium GW2011_GWE1_42_9]|nr:MAG: hypothetical protein UU33_C0001G0372 [Candidatus Azambacteria bacterium GW2011_GWF1_41_10]KKS49406.1 MAG: hypothetical protein UV14_C0001G0152 [Candidatus Azambacteria bacterium GW2011_GWF2_42_22]KKS69467.1 MAG: hypothetical protein UV39_C0010G0007 [Candidatus Azambacteria bacterium GW2011_GWA2_42_62]KKS74328.1 MAG: hypothetical protein UV45_C0007G0022 [Candidatus Azambacteria bacterium GW2011_GWB1_42_72]KKS79237.1 MAG: hypothetical protein UV53_C0011G0010 [Candidatus Azambacteria bacte